ncbi:Kinesin-like protein kif15 [Phytophthora pseudosyringae]|uniref:Kinesin-like protein kif15 n=1 Tax=Phytophthora pseudosyringae TaxID=221518 RepID=A0A8T1VNS3_9STRA|nr:Kinesin-like protein kif15 [Phytophthora pseudosyringae]
MSSLLDVANAMNAEAAGNSPTLSLVDVAKAENAANSSAKSLTLMDVAKPKTQPSQTLQQLAQEIDKEDRSRIQVALESTAREVKVERQELRSQTLKQTAAEVQQEEQQAAKVLQGKVLSADTSKHELADPHSNKENEDDEEGYSSFEEEDDTPKKQQKESAASDEDAPAEEEESYDPPPRTTPSESKESKEFLRAVYRADKYQVRDLLDGEVVEANIADQHGWSGLHWAASQDHGEILELLLQKGAEVNAIDQINGWTALHVAVVRESVSCVRLLLSSGADPRIQDNYGDTIVDCLQAASRNKKVQMLQLLQQARSSCNNSKDK